MSFDLLQQQLQQFGIELPSDFVVDGNLHRFGRKKNSWYALHWFRLDNGQQILTGRFGDWKLGVDEKVDLDMPPLSSEERKRFSAEQKAQAKAAEKAKAEKQAEAAERAAKIWAKLPAEGHSPYLQRKKVAAVGVRFSRGSVVIPLHNVAGKLVGLQFIAPDGSKKFLTGTDKQGAFHVLGDLDPTGRVMLAEGYATGASLFMAMGGKVPCVIAFDAGNLQPVAVALREQYPDLHMVICADNDHKTAGNPGVTKAHLAAKACGARVVIPTPRQAAQGSVGEPL
jgi:putative DNA primase/helicase